MKTLTDVIAEVQAQIAALQVTLADLEALAAAAPTPVADPVVEVDVKTASGAEEVLKA